MRRVSVDLETPTPYLEKDTFFHKLRRDLSYAFAIRKIRQQFSVNAPIAILEVGTGSGFFFSALRRRLPNARLWGIEYDPRLLEETKRRAPFAECVQGNAETFDLLPNSFDVIVSFQVIEHLYDPSAMIRQSKAHLKSPGILIITTPNPDGVGAKVMGKKWHGFRDDHVSLKGNADWVRLIESHGFRTLYSGSTFFSGLPVMNRLPLALVNWSLLVALGAIRWRWGEAFVGVFQLDDNK
jgi:SAM-dependent methyltransferase